MPATRIVSPEGALVGDSFQPAARLTTLRGKRVGLLDNTKVNAAALLEAVGRRLQGEHGVAELLVRRKHERGSPANLETIRELSQCHAVVTAIGD
jgi:hypothetical protein